MVIRSEERMPVQRPAAPDGTRGPLVQNIVEPMALGASGRLFAQITLVPGAAIQKHVHNDEYEIYCILSGSGAYDDNGASVTLSAGDVTLCERGESHALSNIGDTDLMMIAFIGH